MIDPRRSVAFLEEIGLREPESKLQNLRSYHVGLQIDPTWATTINGKIMFETALDLLTRMCGIVYLVGDYDNEFTFLSAALEKTLHVGGKVFFSDISRCDVCLHIGSCIVNGVNHIKIYSNGWEAYVGSQLSIPDPMLVLENPIGACLAAALGVCEVFKFLLQGELERASCKFKLFNSFKLSAYDYGEGVTNPSLPSTLDLGNFILVGAGAIGMAVIFALRYFLKAKGLLIVIDKDKIDKTNLDRYMGTDYGDIGKYKPDVVVDKLVHNENFKVIPFNETYKTFIDRFRPHMDVVISTVDNVKTRQALQSDLPRIILDGATSAQEFKVSRHDFLNNACLGCLHPNDPEQLMQEELLAYKLKLPVGTIRDYFDKDIPLNEPNLRAISSNLNIPWEKAKKYIDKPMRLLWADEVCGRLKFSSSDAKEAGTIGFVSAIPGFLLLGELIKERYFPDGVINQVFHVNTFMGLGKYSLTVFNKVGKSCGSFCNEQVMQEVYRRIHSVPREGSYSAY